MYSTVDRDQFFHRADRFGAERGDADVDGALERAERLPAGINSTAPASFMTRSAPLAPSWVG